MESSKTLEIVDFVKQEEIDPRYFETPYFLVPSKGAEKAYALLREAIRRTGSVGIGKIIMRQKQHLAGIKVVGDALVLEIMRFANELIDADSLNLPDAHSVRPQELQMAEQLVTSLAEPFDPSKYTDDYRANLMRVIKAKMKGKKAALTPEPEEPRDAQVIDSHDATPREPRPGEETGYRALASTRRCCARAQAGQGGEDRAAHAAQERLRITNDGRTREAGGTPQAHQLSKEARFLKDRRAVR